MTDHPTDPPPSDPPVDDRLIRALDRLGDIEEAQTELLAELSRDVHGFASELSGAIRGFAALHADLQQIERDEAEERNRMHADIRLVLESVRGLTTRLTAVESKVAGIELHLHDRANGNGRE